MERLLKYDQARLAVLNFIAEEHLQPGDRLLPERQLVEKMNCSIITLRKALDTLERDGVLTRSVGRGTFVNRCASECKRNGRILFLDVGLAGEKANAMQGAQYRLKDFFHAHGLDFQLLFVNRFSNEIVRASQDVLGIMLSGWIDKEFMDGMKSLNVPMVIVGNSRHFPGVPHVDFDVELCAEIVTNKLLDDGAERIALFNAPDDYFLSTGIYSGFEKAMKKHGRTVSGKKNVYVLSKTKDGGDLEMDRIFPEYANYDAILFETGVYYVYLASARINHWNFKNKIAVLPILSNQFFAMPNDIFRASKDTVFGRFRQSTFDAACQMLLECILHSKTMKTIRLSPEVDDGSHR